MNEQIWSNDDEYFIYDSLQELIENEEDITIGSTVSVGDKVDAVVNILVDADDVIDLLADRAGDNFGEVAEDFPDVDLEAKAELNTLLQHWIDKHCSATFYNIRNVKSYTITEDDMKEIVCG